MIVAGARQSLAITGMIQSKLGKDVLALFKDSIMPDLVVECRNLHSTEAGKL